MRLLVIVALVPFAVPGVVYGHKADGLAAAHQAVRAAQSLTISDLRVQRRAPAGRVRGSVAAGPAGAALGVVVRRGDRRVGHGTLTATAGARTSFAVRIDRASRARLQRVGHLDLRVEVTASAPGAHVSASTGARVTG
ncbi:MAG: hypothetical protein QOI98_3193 [Solirubrobacteraceae bacterium]|jgi:hypothetical protein|nr:hypothetical protein [Solirubrobacteraceae bacterium]